MNDLNLKGSWNQLKGKLKQEYSHLTDNDLAYTEGKEDELLGRLQDKLGKTKDDIKSMFNRMIEPAAHEARLKEERESAGDLDSSNDLGRTDAKDLDNKGSMRRG
jgi:uncharacterized protein YjbJ (UPF0337 family)